MAYSSKSKHSLQWFSINISASITDRTMKTSALSAEKHGTIVPSNLNLGYMNAFYVLRVDKVKIWQKNLLQSNGIILFCRPEIWQFLKASINPKSFTPKVKNIDNVYIGNGVSRFSFRLMLSGHNGVTLMRY